MRTRLIVATNIIILFLEMHFITFFQMCPHGNGCMPAEGDRRAGGGGGHIRGTLSNHGADFWEVRAEPSRPTPSWQHPPSYQEHAHQHPELPLCAAGCFPPSRGTNHSVAGAGPHSAPRSARGRAANSAPENPLLCFASSGIKTQPRPHQKYSLKKVAKDIFDQKDPSKLLKRCLEMDLLCHGIETENPTPTL